MVVVIMSFRRPMKNIWQMAAKYRYHWLLVGLALLMSACAVTRSEPVLRIALLAPFEGRYREIGYNALYAARLALQDAGQTQVELLPIDDGGTVITAVDRALALKQDPLVKVVIVSGHSAAYIDVLNALSDVPVLVVGNWWPAPETSDAYFLHTPAINAELTLAPGTKVTDSAGLRTPLIGGDVFALEQVARLRDSLAGITVVSSSSLPDSVFAERYGSDPFAPEPGLLATLTYDAFGMALQVIGEGNVTRNAIKQAIATVRYAGLNGTITFVDGYWADAPINRYQYNADRLLTPVDGFIE
jgi:hypothetical protein